MSGEEGASGETLQVPKPQPKIDWYQTESLVNVAILAKSVDSSTLKVKYTESLVDISFTYPAGGEYTKTLHLSHKINSETSSHKLYSTKLEIKLPKAEAGHWTKLELDECDRPKPTTSRNWDKVVSEIEEEQPEGEAALQALFQKLYAEGSDEVRKAMNKSFLESGGTELNTNWDAVRQCKRPIKPPEGMEWRSWDS